MRLLQNKMIYKAFTFHKLNWTKLDRVQTPESGPRPCHRFAVHFLYNRFKTNRTNGVWALVQCERGFTPIALYTKLDAECNKQATIVIGRLLTTLCHVLCRQVLSTIEHGSCLFNLSKMDVLWRNFSKTRVWGIAIEGSTLFLQIPKYPYYTV